MLDGFGCLPVALDLFLDSHEGPTWQVAALRGRSGWLSVADVTLDTPLDTLRATIAAACFDTGQPLSFTMTQNIMKLAVSIPLDVQDMPPEELSDHLDMLYWDFLGTCDLHHLALLRAEEEALNARIDAEEQRAEEIFALVRNHLADLRRQRRSPVLTRDARSQIEERIRLIEDKEMAAAQWLRKRTAALREEIEDLETLVLESLTLEGVLEPLYTVHWIARHSRDRRASTIDFQIRTGLPRTEETEIWKIEQTERDARGALRERGLAAKRAYAEWKEKDEERRTKARKARGIPLTASEKAFAEKLPADSEELNALLRSVRERQRVRRENEKELRKRKKARKRRLRTEPSELCQTKSDAPAGE